MSSQLQLLSQGGKTAETENAAIKKNDPMIAMIDLRPYLSANKPIGGNPIIPTSYGIPKNIAALSSLILYLV